MSMVINPRSRDKDSSLIPGLFTTSLTEGDHVSGLQRYEVGLIADYSLNKLFDVSTRYAEWSIRGYVFYTEGLDNKVRGDTQLYGGAGIMLRY